MTRFRDAIGDAGPSGRALGARPARFELEMRALRGQLQPLLADRRPPVIAVTACSLGEGATTIARELSRSLALDGAATLLAGATDAPPGRGPRSVDRHAITTVVPNLDFVDVSDLHGPPSDRRPLLAFRSWLEERKSDYGVVILDTPPFLNQGGWEALFPLEDGILLVVEAERTRAAVLKATIDGVAAAGGHVLGIVFNRRRRRIPDLVYKWL